jgi:hypothetical protein
MSAMRVPTIFTSKLIAPFILLFCLFSSLGVTLNQLQATPDLTPETFGTLFHGFEFKYAGEVQTPEHFLATRSGDCDDFSTLAASVLKEKGYTTRLIAIRMPKIVHVVCYVEQNHAYLDYNLRDSRPLVPCGSEISEIAASVAKYYALPWSSASEFTWDGHVKRLVKTVSRMNSRGGIFATILK